VFVDGTGRRRRVLLTAGVAGVALLLATAIGLLVALTGTSGQALPGLPGSTARPHAASTGHGGPGAATPSIGGTGTPSTAAPGTAATAPTTPPPPVTTSTASLSPSPSTGNPRRHVPTQTPSHSKK
jgi:hypothetical protein